ncbi:epimerase [Pseudidiomarina salinarum]|uniref:Epimerase n=1 Tax=Pseudidiomarina salinarum TaxID=435908 RepID=A0A094IWF4_9GAMM|nr:SDR family oxidoreductase [Pseudidiomarina salinarum]KFZ31427.1 epimerase [Pseudidiomarina salinarum]RUO70815.1 NAD(P)-dependent oxidoreductase [Pseudidiomarina salinarum]
MKRILLLGYGDIAQRVARLMVRRNWQAVGACRHPDDKEVVEGVELVTADATNEQDLRELLREPFDAVLVTMTPDGRDKEAYHKGYVIPCRHLQQVLKDVAEPPRVFYVSSTGVYGQRDGEWVDENSPTEPDRDTGKMLLQAEQAIAGCNAPTTILRCTGIYGPGRDRLREMIRNRDATITPAWSNRIHADDVAGFIVYLLTQMDEPDALYLVTDDEPAQMETVYSYIARQEGIEPAELPRSDEVGPRGSKRCSNKRLRATGYELIYPTFRSGFKV